MNSKKVLEEKGALGTPPSKLPNLITFGRFLLVPIVMILLLTDAPWVGILTATLIFIAGMSDILDGYLARHWKSETNMGKLLDPLVDKTLVMAVLIMMIGLSRVHPVLVVIIVGREIFITGLRAIASSHGLVIGAKTAAKYKTTFQMIAVGGLAIHETYFGINFHLIGLLLLYISLAFSLYSAIEYVELFFKVLYERK
ncbi:MAG: CDP-diacylglycerol--glycerol-3-phosphate 3-phosphatidyltransferase [Deltaproteobacteria bacterium GWA2_38_16]|nr:MAG: CDP-diacylglycerol--glycerol-3-phosphate 3-phosphatidyltransferase [Deltaproteobacteria bacterium GWA2_38_16]OGQ03296.1 MAG: CDP-diacylglycerol--glycerol-3-phosphate 3-phosphatidyltransferase [Deltaproteobacteria bacterium RIFCSPHIGHO2_02_FULL_38_15]OGQ34627.1 MAG: CDP-diacylglycerol--glycerol-3-phosphate 3-phosphatidyltransferase [Deltaproteobacteria bacterium RIFCSPLOWO2_01_FULL_38_9]OGQ61035.1 MAG: CDP-diacylglycerol--glycerol-3-phosphate 3-phosphatidyltransferase [Deltaproteobacteria